eukprot:13740771-Alexandrium_andersonii.AAC.1
MGPFLLERTFDNVAAASGLPRASVRTKALETQRRTAPGARKSRSNDQHSQAGPRRGAVLRAREAQRGLGWRRSEEDGRSRGGKVGPEAALRLGH